MGGEAANAAIGRELGNYVVRSLIGTGGMGAVYAAEHRFLGSRVAVKLLHGSFANDPAVAQRFFLEAKSSLQIGHANVIKTLDFGQTAAGELYLVMELLDGRSLRETLASDGPFAEGACARLGSEIADGLAAAHAHGIVHRDLKPDNIFITTAGEPKVLDFGIAKVTSTATGTQSGSILGTPRYMAPEQAKGSKHVGPHTDIYALGAILYEMLTGQPPFPGEDITELLAKHLFEPPPSPAASAPVSAEMDALVLSCLSKDAALRPASMVELRDRLRGRVHASAPPAPRPAQVVAATPQTTLGHSAAQIESVPGSARRSSFAFIALGAIAVVGLGVLGWLRVHQSAAPTVAPTVTPVVQAVAPAPVTPPPEPLRAPSPPQRVSLLIRSDPPGAEVYRAADGVLIGTTPTSESLSPTNGRAVYSIKLRGYQDARVELAADQDGEQLVTLSKLRTRTAPTPEPAKAPRPRIRDGAIDPFAP